MGWIILIVVVLILIWIVSVYNGLISSRQKVENAWSQIDVQLQRRFDLIPNFVETVKGYMTHESETFEKIAKLRTSWANTSSVGEKAKLDGYWKEHESFLFDLKCLLGTVLKVGHDDSVVEGGTGAMEKKHRKYTDNKTNDELIGKIGFSEPVEIDRQTKKKVLITGAGSYIGQSFINYAKKNYPDNFEIEELDLMETSWNNVSFSKYDIVYHVAGIAHADVGKVAEETKEKYYKVNTDLTVEVAKKAKEDGVREFIFMSSMIIYGESAPYGKKKVIDENTVPMPANFYGDSKLQADVAVRDLADNTFKVIVLRPPMIYGKESKGNYCTGT